MELESQPLVDPELRAFIFNRVSSLGGTSAAEDGRYVIGDDLLPSLKDIRDWLQHFNDKLNRLDVARLLAEANLVRGDLLEILAGWPETAAEDSFRSKVALRCVDLLMQLTWPVDREENNTTQNLLFHKPYVQSAQAAYKQAILQHPTNVLRKAARAGLPAMAQPQRERSVVDDSIINVELYFFRNIAMINKPEHVDADEDDTEISRSTTIDAFHHQDVFDILLTTGSGIIDEFTTHDLELLDILFHLLKGIDVERLFMEKQELMSANTHELQSLIGKEKSMHLGYKRHAPSRHNRFGTMLWMKRGDGNYSTLLGQTAATNDESTLHSMDKAKKWKKPRRPVKRGLEDPLTEFNGNVPLTGSARRHLRQFVEQFLDSSFNPLFLAVRRSIEREVPRLQPYHARQYFFLTSWFLRAEHARRRRQREMSQSAPGGGSNTQESFGLVASVLTQETFVLMNRRMQKAHDEKSWQDLNACMRCFSQILQTVSDMSESRHEEDQEIAENTLSRIFYEQTTHDQITNLLRTFKDQGFGYLDSLTDLSHVFMRTLERYSKQNEDMQVRSMRRSRKKKAARNGTQGTSNNVDRELEADDREEAQRVSSERKFDFMRFCAKMINQNSIETFVTFLRYYKELGTDQLKRAHRFFYRTAFKMEMTMYLFRVDIVLLLQMLVKGPDGMDQEDPMFKEWEELVRQIFRQLVKKMQSRPALGVELLFSKIPNTVYYLEHGYEREIPKSTPKAPADLEVKPGMELRDQIGVAVSTLINQSKTDHLAWVKTVLTSAVEERKAWEEMHSAQEAAQESLEGRPAPVESSLFGDSNEESAMPSIEQPQLAPADTGAKVLPPPILVRPDSPERRTAVQKDRHLRLLLRLLSFDHLDVSRDNDEDVDVQTSWTVPPSQSSTDLQESYDLIAKFEFAPPAYDGGKRAEDFLRRKPNTTFTSESVDKQRGAGSGLDSDSEGGSIHSDDEALFPAGGPTARKPDHKPKKGKKRARHEKDPLSDEQLEKREVKRKKTEREKAAKIKSSLFISASDDEDDEDRDRAFFEKEAEMARHQAKEVQKQSLRLRGLLKDGVQVDDDVLDTAGKSIQTQGFAEDSVARRTATDDEAQSEGGVHGSGAPSKTVKGSQKQRRRRAPSEESSMSEDSDDLDALSGDDLPPRSQRRGRPLNAGRKDVSSNVEEDDDIDTPPSSQRPSSGHADKLPLKGVFTVTDDDSEGSDKENAVNSHAVSKIATVASGARRRGPFVIEDDSDDE